MFVKLCADRVHDFLRRGLLEGSKKGWVAFWSLNTSASGRFINWSWIDSAASWCFQGGERMLSPNFVSP